MDEAADERRGHPRNPTTVRSQDDVRRLMKGALTGLMKIGLIARDGERFSVFDPSTAESGVLQRLDGSPRRARARNRFALKYKP